MKRLVENTPPHSKGIIKETITQHGIFHRGCEIFKLCTESVHALIMIDIIGILNNTDGV